MPKMQIKTIFPQWQMLKLYHIFWRYSKISRQINDTTAKFLPSWHYYAIMVIILLA